MRSRLVKMSKTWGMLAAAVLLCMAAAGPSPARVIYVDGRAGGSNSGASWPSAYSSLQDALSAASDGDEIWVAAGVYKPGADADSTFAVPDGVSLYGGFAGTETTCAQRDWSANVTVLSGDIDGNDATDANGVVAASAGINGANAYHVVWMSDVTGATRLDGFTITGGNANAGDTYPNGNGGGMYCNGQCAPTVAHVTFSGNRADWMGGGMYNRGYTGSYYETGGSSPVLSTVIFSGNEAGFDGGALYNDGWYGYASPVLSTVTFSGNKAGFNGGAIHNSATDWGRSKPVLSNVACFGNSAGHGGGAMMNTSYAGGIVLAELNTSTFSGNDGGAHGAAIYNYVGDDAESRYGRAAAVLNNAILWGNTVGGSSAAQIENEDSNCTAAVSYGVVQGGCPAGTGCDHLIADDPLFMNSAENDFHLQSGSPAVDAGTNVHFPQDTADLDEDGSTTEPLPFDIGGGLRIRGAAVDLGAYETEDPPACAVRIIPKNIGWLAGERVITRRLLVIGNKGTVFGNDTEVSWYTDAIETLGRKIFFDRFMLMKVRIDAAQIGKGDYTVTVGTCTGTVHLVR